MQFEQYLAQRRKPRKFNRYQAKNPYADEFASELNQNLSTVEKWINGSVNTEKMIRAMQFFERYFGDRFRATEGRKVYRGQSQLVFDGTPRSYSYEKKVAEAFAENQCGWFAPGCKGYVIERLVCSLKPCSDARAFRLSLDLGKLMKAYASHKYALEREVVILNTKPKGSARIYEVVNA